MIPITNELRTFLASTNRYCIADLYTFYLLNGDIVRVNSADLPLTWNGNTYYALGGTGPNGISIERTKIKMATGVQVDDLQVDLYPSPNDVIGGNTFLELSINGGLDGCYMQLDRAFLASWNTGIVGIVPKRFYGRIAGLTAGRSKITLNLKSDLDLLNIQMPRVLFQTGCSHSLYDGGCTLHIADFTVSGTVTGVSSASAIATTISNTPGYMVLGVLTFTSGGNDGLSAAIKTDDGSGNLMFQIPWPKIPKVGDTFTAYRGCTKTQDACNTFSNIQNFRGFPYVPSPETAIV